MDDGSDMDLENCFEEVSVLGREWVFPKFWFLGKEFCCGKELRTLEWRTLSAVELAEWSIAAKGDDNDDDSNDDATANATVDDDDDDDDSQ